MVGRGRLGRVPRSFGGFNWSVTTFQSKLHCYSSHWSVNQGGGLECSGFFGVNKMSLINILIFIVHSDSIQKPVHKYASPVTDNKWTYLCPFQRILQFTSSFVDFVRLESFRLVLLHCKDCCSVRNLCWQRSMSCRHDHCCCQCSSVIARVIRLWRCPAEHCG